MTDSERRDVEGEVAVAVSRLVTSLPDPAARLAAATYLASGAWSRRASEMKDLIVVAARREHPGETYEQTAARLGVSEAVVNRAVVRDALREREAAS